jgi:hypothetical protein
LEEKKDDVSAAQKAKDSLHSIFTKSTFDQSRRNLLNGTRIDFLWKLLSRAEHKAGD